MASPAQSLVTGLKREPEPLLLSKLSLLFPKQLNLYTLLPTTMTSNRPDVLLLPPLHKTVPQDTTYTILLPAYVCAGCALVSRPDTLYVFVPKNRVDPHMNSTFHQETK